MFDIQGGKEYFLAASDAFSCVGYFKCAGSKKKKKKKEEKTHKPLKAVFSPHFFKIKRLNKN